MIAMSVAETPSSGMSLSRLHLQVNYLSNRLHIGSFLASASESVMKVFVPMADNTKRFALTRNRNESFRTQ